MELIFKSTASNFPSKVFLFIINFILVGSGFMIIGHFWIGLLYLILYATTWAIRMEIGLSGSIYPFFVLFASEAHLFYQISEKREFDFSYKWSIKNAILFLLYFWALPYFTMNIFWAAHHLSTRFLIDTGATLWGLIAGFIVYQRTNHDWLKTIIWTLIVAFSNIIYAVPALILLFYLIVWYGVEGRTEIEKTLETFYTDAFIKMMNIPEKEARETARGLINNCIKESKAEGTYNFPNNAGNIMLEKEKSDPKTKKWLDELRSQGVRDEDILWWWNMNDIERRMMRAFDDVIKIALLKKEMAKGKNMDESMKNLRKHFVIYGLPDEPKELNPEDRNIPYELKDRINKCGIKNAQRVDQIKVNYSSMNALVRSEIREGLI